MIQAPVLGVKQITDQIFCLTLSAPEWARAARSGHFVNVQVPQCGEVLWRRPFSVHDADPDKGTIDILFAAIGRGSHVLSLCKAGDVLSVLGLLGNYFTIPPDLKEIVIVAGGIGIAPFNLLLRQVQAWPGKKIVFYGVRTANQVCCIESLQQLGADVRISTEDGTLGQKGLITGPLEEHLASSAMSAGRMLYICGPTPMLRAVRELTQKYKTPAQVTVENKMACGFGACVGCPVELAQPRSDGQKYLLACKDGPVFPLEEILLND
jgi:dihydroorotate dehydrogenase electron transfer subunit